MLLLRHDPELSERLPKSELRPARRMTIAAAFYCTDGVVVCADSSEETDLTKRDQGKIRGFVYEGESYVFTGAGHADLLEAAMEDIVDSRRRRKKLQSWEWKAELKKDAAKIFEDYVKPCSGFRDQDRIPQMSLIASIQVDGLINIFHLRDALVRKIKPLEHVSVGVGNLVASSLIDRHLKGANLTMEMTSRVGAYILERVKKTVSGCGGYTHFFRQGVDGSVKPGYATAWVPAMAGLDASTTSLIYGVMESDDGMFDKAIENLVLQLRNVRLQFKPEARMAQWKHIGLVESPAPPKPSTSRKSKRVR